MVLTAVGQRAVMDAVRCQDGDDQRTQNEPGTAGWNGYRHNSFFGLLRPFARGLFTRGRRTR